MSIKDPFEILADEITLIRRQIEQLQRTSLDRKDAEHLNAVVANSLERMAKVGPTVQQRIEQSLATAAIDVRAHAMEAAASAARDAIREAHRDSLEASQRLLSAAGEARRQAWRYFGGFWVWLTSVGAAFFALGLLTMFLLQGRADAHKFGQSPSIFCKWAGGETMSNDAGDKACVFWIDTPLGQE